jgi:hypothetical protein
MDLKSELGKIFNLLIVYCGNTRHGFLSERNLLSFSKIRQKHPQHFNCSRHFIVKKEKKARHWWLTPVILATQEAEIRRITV